MMLCAGNSRSERKPLFSRKFCLVAGVRDGGWELGLGIRPLEYTNVFCCGQSRAGEAG